MNYSTFFNKLISIFLSILFQFLFLIPKRPKISLLIPFSTTDPNRQANVDWLLKYWKHELPNAEIVIGESKSEVFCKAEALNDAVAKSRGKVLVIMDADAYIDGKVINQCADLILEYRKNHLWFVPYRRLYRLNQEMTSIITKSNPKDPFRFFGEVPDYCIENGNSIHYGHRYGAMCMMFHYDAYKAIGGFDERFKGWGGEDVCLLRALDTIYGKHKTANANIFHLWHSFFGHTYEERRWEGQEKGGSNWTISKIYGQAERNPAMMRWVLKEAEKFRHKL